MAAVDALPPMPTRGGDQPPQTSGGDLSAMFQAGDQQQQKADVQEVMQKMRQEMGRLMRDIDRIAGQFPMASEPADLAKKGLDAMLKAIVKNSPTGPDNTEPSLPA